MLRSTLIAAIYTFGVCNLAAFADSDPIKDRLDSAKVQFDKEVDTVHAKLMTTLTEKRDSAKRSGSLETVEKVQAEIDAFDSEDRLPTSVSNREYKRAMVRACKKMEDAYITARKESVQADKIDDAKAIEAELNEFKASVSADFEPDSGAVNKRLLDASRASMAENPNLYFYVCTGLPGERVLRATRRKYGVIPSGNHPEDPAVPLRDVRLSAYGGEPTAGAVRLLARLCDAHNARIRR